MSGSAAVALAHQVHAQLLELAVQVGALQAGLLGHAGHGAALVGEVELEVGLLKGVAGLAQRAVQVEVL